MRHRSSTRTATTIASGLAALVLAACGGGSDGDATSEPALTVVDVAADGASASGIGGTDAPDEEPDVTEAPTTTVAEVNSLTDFGDVCRGVKLPGATPYDPARPGIHPIKVTAGEAPEYGAGGSGLPSQWDPVIGEEQTVELVVCMDRTSTTLVETCTGYVDDAGVDTGGVVEVYDASYDIRLVAAVDGSEIARTQLDGTGLGCPSFAFFDDGGSVERMYSEPSDAMTAWLVGYVET